MDLIDFQPENELERAIVRAKQSLSPMGELMDIVLGSNLFVSSKREVQQDGSGFDPLLLGESGNALVAAFSSLSRPGLHRHRAEYVLQMNGKDFILRLPPGYGVILNPGYVVQLIVLSNAVSELKSSLRAR